MDMTKNSGIINLNKGNADSKIDNSKHTSPTVTIFIVCTILLFVSYLLIQAKYPEYVPKLFEGIINKVSLN